MDIYNPSTTRVGQDAQVLFCQSSIDILHDLFRFCLLAEKLAFCCLIYEKNIFKYIF